MKTNIEIKKRNNFLTGRKLADVCIKMKKNIRIFLYLIIFTGSGMLLNSCFGGYGYVASEPNYDLNYARPERPAEGYIWIDGDWLWNNSSRTYIRQSGYWSRPRHGRAYEAGRWESRPEGKLWIRGRWTKQNERSANRNNQGDQQNRNERSRPSDPDRDK
jgi:hypothetical protein